MQRPFSSYGDFGKNGSINVRIVLVGNICIVSVHYMSMHSILRLYLYPVHSRRQDHILQSNPSGSIACLAWLQTPANAMKSWGDCCTVGTKKGCRWLHCQPDARSKIVDVVRLSLLNQSSSVKSAISPRLNIMTNNPIVTIISSENPIQPSTIAVVPIPLFTLPFPRSCAIVLAPTEAVCCHSTDTRTKTDATKMRARATWQTARDGKGLTSFSSPRSSSSSCQPGKVARMTKTTKASTIATML